MRQPAALAIAAALALAVVGCDGPGGEEAGDQRKAALELQIRGQLPDQARRLLGTPVVVSAVGCTELTETTFDCLSTLEASDLRGRPVRQNLAIDGSCDDERCLWSVKGP